MTKITRYNILLPKLIETFVTKIDEDFCVGRYGFTRRGPGALAAKTARARYEPP